MLTKLCASLYPTIGITALLFVMLLLTGSTAQATAVIGALIVVTTTDDDMTVNGSCSLREAVQAANIGATVDGCVVNGNWPYTIQLPAGVYRLTLPGRDESNNLTGDLNINNGVIIQGSSAATTIIDANQLDRAMFINMLSGINDTVELHNLSLINGNVTSTGGGALLLGQGRLIVDRCTIQNNTSLGDGGGIDVMGDLNGHATAVIQNSIIRDNTAYRGGGIFNYAPSGLNGIAVAIANTQIYGNSADRGGGIGILGEGRGSHLSIHIVQSSIISNTGGGVYTQIFSGTHALLSIANSKIRSNLAVNGSAGIYSEASGDGSIIRTGIARSDIISNTGRGVGGVENLATQGASAQLTITDGAVIGNNATFGAKPIGNIGGGIVNTAQYTGSIATAWVTDTLVANNHAYFMAGGITNSAARGQAKAEFTLIGSQVQANSTDDNGGGITNWSGDTNSSAQLQLFGDLVIENYSPHSGAGISNIQNSGQATVSVDHSTVYSNVAGISGGGLLNAFMNPSDTNTARVTIRNSTISANVAVIGAGGGLDNIYDNSITRTLPAVFVDNSTFEGNQAQIRGNDIDAFLGGVQLKNSILNEDCSGSIESYGFNLIKDTTTCTVTPIANPNTDIFGQDAKLNPLTPGLFVHVPQSDSPVIDNGSCLDIENKSVSDDQIGNSRPSGANCDIGAVEFGATLFKPSLSFAAPTYTTSEDAGALSITVTQDRSIGVTTTIDYAVQATLPLTASHVQPYTGTVVFPPYVTSQTITLPIANNTRYEEPEIVRVTLTNPQNADLGAITTTTVTVNDDDSHGAQFITVMDKGNMFPNQRIEVYIGGPLVYTGTLNENSQWLLSQIASPGEPIDVFVLQHTETTTKEFHPNGAYQIFTTNVIVDRNGVAHHQVVDKAQGELRIAASRTNTLIRLNFVIVLQWKAYTEDDKLAGRYPLYITHLKDEVIPYVARRLFNMTNGQFTIGTVTVFDGGEHWNAADIRVMTSNDIDPGAAVGGIVAESLTITHTDGIVTHHEPGYILMPRDLEDQISKPIRERWQDWGDVLVHELGHYALFLFDQYYVFKNSEKMLAQCKVEQGPPSCMDTPTSDCELPTRDWPPSCLDTDHSAQTGESPWDTIRLIYHDLLDRWQLVLPDQQLAPLSKSTQGRPIINPGPNDLIDMLPKIIAIVPITQVLTGPPTYNLTITSTESTTTTRRCDANCTVYVQKPNGDVMAVGSPDTGGNLTVPGLEPGDRIIVEPDNGPILVTKPFVPGLPIQIEPPRWNPKVDVIPLPDWGGVAVTVTQTSPLTQTISISALHGILREAGNDGYTTEKNLDKIADKDIYVQILPLDATKTAKQGLIFVKDLLNNSLQTLTEYLLATLPTSHFWGYLDVTSFDTRVQARIPLSDTVPAGSTVLVATVHIDVPVKQTVTTAGLSGCDTGVPARLQSQHVIGPLYSITNSSNVTKTQNLWPLSIRYKKGSITLDLSEQALQIYFANTTTCTWEPVGGTVDATNTVVSTAVNRFGLYALMIDTTLQVTQGGEYRFVYPLAASQPITAALSQCNYGGLYIYDPKDHLWRKFVAGAPAYVNDFTQFDPGQEYYIWLNQPCGIDFSKISLADGKGGVVAATLFTPVTTGSGLPTLPVGFYGEAPHDSGVVRICRTDFPDLCKSTSIFSYEGSLVYKIDVDVDSDRAISFTLQVGVLSKTVVGQSGRTQAINFDNLYLPLISTNGDQTDQNSVPNLNHELYLPLIEH